MSARLSLTIDSDNAAFETPEDAAFEFSRLLREVANKVAPDHSGGTLRDSNGNYCGSWTAVHATDDSEDA